MTNKWAAVLDCESTGDDTAAIRHWLDSLSCEQLARLACLIAARDDTDMLGPGGYDSYVGAAQALDDYGRLIGFPHKGYDTPGDCLFLAGKGAAR